MKVVTGALREFPKKEEKVMRMKCLGAVLGAALLGSTGSVHAQSEFFARLSGAEEVPPVASSAFGSATFDLNISGGVLGVSYSLVVNNMKDAFMAHLHCGAKGQNGPIVVWLAGNPAAPAGTGYDLNGPWVGSAKFKAGNIVPGTNCGNTLTDLIAAMAAGRVYVNVHTVANGGGEIRGQTMAVAGISVP